MKKYLVLTSVLALAACGGGSGGGNGGTNDIPGSIETPEKPFVPVKDTVAASNAQITGMVSNSETQVVTYVVNKLGNDAESVGFGNIARSTTSRAAFVPSVTAGNTNYDKAKELMELAQWLGDDTTTHNDIVSMFNKSKSDQNKIKSALKLLDDMWCYVGGSADETARRILEHRAANKFDKPLGEIKEKSEIITLRDVYFLSADKEFADTNEDFAFKFIINEDGQIIGLDTIDDGQNEIIKREGDKNKFDTNDGDGSYATVNMLGNKIGLKYSDFGFLNMYENEDAEKADNVLFSMPIAGGYTTKMIDIDKDNLASNIVFNGIAVGNVGEPDTSIKGDRLQLRDNSATLTFEKGTGNQILRANFDNWYDVSATKYADGDAQIVFSNGDNIADNDKFWFKQDGERVASFDTGKVANDKYENQVSVNFDYYGDNGNAAEATGIIFYDQNAKDDNAAKLLMGFGGTAK